MDPNPNVLLYSLNPLRNIWKLYERISGGVVVKCFGFQAMALITEILTNCNATL